MNYVGVDLHKEQSWFHVMNGQGQKLSSRSIPNTEESLKHYFQGIHKPFSLAVESTYNWYFFVDIAEQYAEKVYLANSYELKAFAKRNKKTDKIDARLIAGVLRKGYLPTVTIPSKEIRMLKEVLHYRMNLTKERTRAIIQLKSLLDRIGEDSAGDFTTEKRLKMISVSHLSIQYQQIIKGYSAKIKYLTDMINTAEKPIKEYAQRDNNTLYLMSIPGLSYFSAALVISEIIDIHRFATFNRLCAYAGLSPRTHQSGNRTFHGALNTNRRKHLQWILLETTFHFIRADQNRKQRFIALAKKKGYNTAKVRFAREMLKIIYHVLKEQRPYYHAQEETKIRYEAVPALAGV